MVVLREFGPRRLSLHCWILWLVSAGMPVDARASGSSPARAPSHDSDHFEAPASAETLAVTPSDAASGATSHAEPTRRTLPAEDATPPVHRFDRNDERRARHAAGQTRGVGDESAARNPPGPALSAPRLDGHAARAPNRWRAALEMAIALGGGTVWYVIDDRNVLDWDHPSLRQRITGEAWRYDNNGPVINFLLHPLSGAAFYTLARANRIGVAESFVYGLAASTAWEYVIEFNEKISINDMIVTPMGGFAIGAFADKLARYLNDVPPVSAAHAAAQWTFGPSIRLHRTLDGEPPPDGVVRDRLGLAATFWHAFAFHYEGGWGREPGYPPWSSHDFGFTGTLASLPGYRRPGNFGRWFHDADVSRLGFAMDWTDSDAGASLVTDTLLAGYHRQSLSGSSEAPQGVMWTTAASLAYRYRHTRRFGFDDREGVVGFPGPALDLYAASAALRAELSLRANVEFAGQTSLAAPQWRTDHPGVRTKAIIEREGYFFGWGGSVAAWGEASVGPLWTRAHGRHGWYDSQEGLDRTQDRLDDDTEFHEIIKEYGYSAGIELCPALRVGVVHEVRHRLSTAGPVTANRAAEHIGGVVRITF